LRRNNFEEYGGAAWFLVGFALLAAVLGLRYGVIEAGLLPLNCAGGAGAAPAWQCALKTVLVHTFIDQRVGWFSLATGAIAFAWSCRRLAWAGWLSGIAGLVLYSFDPAAVGALLALFVLARPRQQHRNGEQQPDQQPADGLRIGRFG